MKLFKESGAVIPEMALMLPVMVLLTFASIQFTLLINAYISLKSASVAVAKYAILSNPQPSSAEVETFANKIIDETLDVSNLQSPLLENLTVGSLDAKKVTLTYNAPIIIPIPGRSGATFPIKATAVMW